MKVAVIIPLFLFCQLISGQAAVDAWIDTQLDEISWQATFKGVLADYHPIVLELFSDHHQVAGYLIHEGDQHPHKLLGDWSQMNKFQLQERDQYDRLAGYLTGSITKDQVQMEWMSADQSRKFNIKAFPERLININSFKPGAEWIEVATVPSLYISVQKMDFGIISGIANRDGHYARFEGQCLDGTCSIWNTLFQFPGGDPIHLQMRQKDNLYYKASINGVENRAEIRYVTPLSVRRYDNSMGFLDFVYPQLESKEYEQWLEQWIDTLWADGVNQLTSSNRSEVEGRLVYRASGWVEIMDESESFVSGMITYINPEMVRREVFVWLKKEDQFVSQKDLINTPEDLQKAASIANATSMYQDDIEFETWLKQVGYTSLLPTHAGVVMATEFNRVYGDDFTLISLEDSKAVIKRKYWRYFGW